MSAGQQWVSNAYLLALGSLILVGGSPPKHVIIGPEGP